MAKAPADQFYYGDWLRDVELQMSSSATRGIWMNALARMWFAEKKGELKGTEEKLARFLNATDVEFDVFLKEAEMLLFCYLSRNGNGIITLRNRRMYREEKKRESNRLRQERFKKKPKSNGQGNARITPPSSSSSSSLLKKKENKERKSASLFVKFWEAYPKKKSKGQAEKAFAKTKPDEQLLAIMLATIEQAKKSEDWQKENGKYIPYPATWLNAKGWEDEIMDQCGEPPYTEEFKAVLRERGEL